jgi:thioredoxin 2
MIRKCVMCKQANEIPANRLMDSAKCGGCGAPLAPPFEPLAADNESFDATLKGTKLPVLVDFWAPWCAPCRRLAPELEKVAKNMSGEAIVLKVNTEQQSELAARFQIRSIPHLMVFLDGEPRMQHSGLVTAPEMEKWLREVS